MFSKLFIVVIALVLLNTVVDLESSAGKIVDHFLIDYQRTVCARQDVFQRNLRDSASYLTTRYESLKDRSLPIESLFPPAIACEDEDFLVYREKNEKLPLVYPNWIYKEGVEP